MYKRQVGELPARTARVKEANAFLRDALSKYPKVHINSPENAIPHILNLSVENVKGTVFQRELDAANAASGKPYQIEISIGCARLEPDIATVHDLIDKADQEMYHLKTRKRGIS